MTTAKFQAEITGYGGQAVNLLAACDMESGLLLVLKALAPGERTPGALIISNDPRSQARDSFFTEQDLHGAIEAYFMGKATGLIELHQNMSQHDPVHRIESMGVEVKGTQYRLAPDISNGNVAVLALALAAKTHYGAQQASDFCKELADMFMSI